jgi:hypothetical protein
MQTKSSLGAGSTRFRFLGFALSSAYCNATSRAFAAKVSAIFSSKAFPNFWNNSRMVGLLKVGSIPRNSFMVIMKSREVFGVFTKVGLSRTSKSGVSRTGMTGEIGV